MEVIPAIDLKGGRCVRLRQGDFVQETVFSDDPLATARSWQEQGAGRLHLVDLDGAAGGEPAHLEVITAIVRSLTIPVQVGGGIRTVAAAEAWLAAGADRVVIGTAAVRNPNMVKKLCQLHGGHRVVAAADARDGKVAVQGWTEASEIDVLDLAGDMAAIGVERLLYTDIARDGMLSGPDLETNTLLARQTTMAVLASGGVSSLEDIRNLAGTGVEGVVVGQALYTGVLDLAQSVTAARG